MALTKAHNRMIEGASANVKDYGAVGDGSTDDTNAIQSAVDAINTAGGGTVVFPQGTYLLNGVEGDDGTVHGIHVPHNGLAIQGSAVSINLVGEGKDTILKAGTTDMFIVRFSASHSGMEKFQLLGHSDGTSQGLVLVASDEEADDLGQVDQSHNSFRQMFIYRCAEGVRLRVSISSGSACYYNTFDDFHIVFGQTPVGSNGGRGVYIDYTGPDENPYSPANRNKFSRFHFGRLNTGFEIDVADTNTGFDLSFEGISVGTSPNGTPTAIKVGDSLSNNFNRFFGCTSEGCDRSLDIGNIRTEFWGCTLHDGGVNFPNGHPAYRLGGASAANQPTSMEGFTYNVDGDLEVKIGYTGDTTIYGPTLINPTDNEGTSLMVGAATFSTAADSASITGGAGYFSRMGAYPLYVNRGTDDGELVLFLQGGVHEGTISVSGNTVTYGTFTGAHWSHLSGKNTPEILIGTVVEATNELCSWKSIEFEVGNTVEKKNEDGSIEKITQTGTLKENYYGDASVGETVEHWHNGVSLPAVVSEKNNKNLSQFKVSDVAESSSVYGVFMDWKTDSYDANIASLGTYRVRIGAGRVVSNGDLLVSAGDGTAKTQSDDIFRAKTIAKVTSTEVIETYEDGSYTVPCTLHCG